MTITVESSAVGGGIEYHQPPIHSESLTRSKTVSFAETHWRKAISMSVVEMYFLIEMYRFHGSHRPWSAWIWILSIYGVET